MNLLGSVVNQESRKSGLSPGTLIHIGSKTPDFVKLTVMQYRDDFFREGEITSVEAADVTGKETITWLNIDGLAPQVIEATGRQYGLHPLLLEDILNTGQRPKCDDYGEYLFLVVKMLKFSEKTAELQLEQVSLVLGSNYLISFQEDIGDVFDPVRQRLRSGKGRLRKMGPDYLAYTLMDTIVDQYFAVLEFLDERLEKLEEELMVKPTQHTLRRIHKLKREMLFIRRAVRPLREALNLLERTESSLIRESTRIFIRDLYDHTVRVVETIETFQEMLSGMLDIYLSSASNKMNEVMKVLTVISTIFIPLNFVAGVYGMNFKYMPELNWRSGYFVVLGVMAAVALWMIYYFRRKKWL